MSMFWGLEQRRAIAALTQAGNDGPTALEIWNRASQGDASAGAQIIAASQNKGLPYTPLERPRLLEEGLPIPPDYAFWLAIVYMMKKQPKMLERLASKFMDTQARIIGNLAQAGTGNIVTAYSHSFLIALMLEQNYMIRQRGADDLIVSLNWLTASQVLPQLLQGFAVPEIIQFATTGTVGAGRSLPSMRAK